MVLAGAGIGVGLIVLDERLKSVGSGFRTYVMPVAVGIYLSWSLSVPIFFGGIAAWITARAAGAPKQREATHRGVLVSSGLIAGEALTGIVIAIVIFALSLFDIKFRDLMELPRWVENPLSAVTLLIVIAGMIVIAVKGLGETRRRPPAETSHDDV
jgi:uncharacterized oligopeptide transporter (OPT) family protein